MRQPVVRPVSPPQSGAIAAGPASGPRPVAGPASPAVAGGIGIALIAQVVTTLLRFVNAPLAARILGAEAFGLYRLALSTVSVATVLASGGLQNALLAVLPRRRAVASALGTRALSTATWYGLTVATVMAVWGIASRTAIAHALGQPAAAPYVAIVAASLPFAVLLTTTQAGSRSVFAMAEAVIPSNILRPVLLATLLAVLLGAGGVPFLVPWGYTLTTAAAAAVGVCLLVRRPEFGIRWLRPQRFDGELLSLSLPFLAIAVLQVVNESIMVFILGRVAPATDIARYAAADRAAALVASVLYGVNMAFAPVIADLWVHGAMARLRTFFRRTTKWSLGLSLPACVVMIVAGGDLLRIFGPEYPSASAALALLALGQLVNAGTGSVGYLLSLTGHHRLVVINTGGSVAASAVLGALIVPRFGVTGAAAVTAAALAGLNAVTMVQVWRLLKMHPFSPEMLRVVAVGAGAAAVGWGLAARAWGSWPVGLAVTVAGVLTASVGLIALIGIAPEDRDLFWMVVGEVRRKMGRRVGGGSTGV